MSKSRRLIGLVVVVVLLGAGAYALTWRSEIEPIERPDPSRIDAALVEEGARLAALGNCIACHTVPGEDAFAGGLPVPTPFGTIYSTNITPHEETGIGSWNQEAFSRALREGVGREGQHLYPAFPYDHYTLISDEDAEALYAYLMTREPVEAVAPDHELPFPLNVRAMVAGWKLLFFDEGRFEADPEQSETWNRGAYLADGLGHCGGCHTPRNALGAREDDSKWAGGEAEGWTAYPINADSPAPIPWTSEALSFYLRHGWHPEHGVSRGPMADVTGNLARLSDEDIAAIAEYTASIMGEPSQERQDNAEALRQAVAEGRGADQQGDTQTQPEAPGENRGAELYAATCATCHDSGRPQPYGGLDFRLSTAVNADDPQNIINVTLFGLPPADGEASAVMPAYRSILSDEDLAAIMAYMRETFTDEPAWEDLEEMVAETRDGAEHIFVRPTDGIERAPGNLGAEEQAWRQD